MTILLYCWIGLEIACLGILIYGVVTAPIGHEDELNGFQIDK